MNAKQKTFLSICYAWLIWSLAASFFFYKYLIQVSPSVMSSQLMQAFDLTGAGLGNLAACFFYAYLLMQLPAGVIVDKFGPRNLIGFGAAMCAAAIALMAHADSFALAAISRFIIGLSASFAAIACFKLITIWFEPKQFAFMAGLSMTVAMLGAVAGEAPLAYLVEHYDWRTTLNIIAYIGAGLSIAIFLIIPNKKAPIPRVQKTVTLKERAISIARNRQNWLLSIYSGLAFAPLSVFGGLWGVSYISTSYQLSEILAAKTISLVFIGFAIGAPIFGWLSDLMKVRKRFMWIGTIASMISLSIVVIFPQLPIPTLSTLLFIFGFGTSCFFLCFSMIREINSLVFSGTVLGLMNAFDALSEAGSEPIVGMILDYNWQGTLQNGVRIFTGPEYQIGLSILCVYLFAALITLFFIQETHCKAIDA